MTWDEYFINLLEVVASKSKDSTKVGCVIVGPNNEIRSTGYNGFPRGSDDNCPERRERPEKYIWTEHAERNTIFNAARMGISLDGCISYQTWYPCCDCARALIQVGIKEIVIDFRKSNPWHSKESSDRWQENLNKAIQMLDECRVVVRKFCDY